MEKKIYSAPVIKVVDLMVESVLYAVSGEDTEDSDKTRHRYNTTNSSIWSHDDE